MGRMRVMLVGGGHANLFVAAHAARLREAGADVTLIDPGMFWYSGMATGLLAGRNLNRFTTPPCCDGRSS